MSAQGMMDYLDPDTQVISFVSGKFAFISFLYALDAVIEITSNLKVKISNNPLSLARS